MQPGFQISVLEPIYIRISVSQLWFLLWLLTQYWYFELQVRCLYSWLFSEKGSKGFCSGLSSWRESVIWPCWWDYKFEHLQRRLDFTSGFSLFWPVDCLSFSYWCSWWFSIWMVVCILGHIHRKDQWEALGSCCLLYRG